MEQAIWLGVSLDPHGAGHPIGGHLCDCDAHQANKITRLAESIDKINHFGPLTFGDVTAGLDCALTVIGKVFKAR
ncbi:hypothetical protein JCM9533A_53700 [Catenuloplanes niger JCM 9533]